MRINPMKQWPLILLMAVGMGSLSSLHGQAIGASGELRWLRVNSLHSYFSEQGSEGETGGTEGTNNVFAWPAEYSKEQWTMRARGMWLGCKDFYSVPLDRTFPYFIVNCGMKVNEYPARPIFDAEQFEMVGRFNHPIVIVDDTPATINNLYDPLDNIDENLPADRMLVIQNNSTMGVTITRKIYAFTRSGHDNYYIYDYVLKNTGIIDAEGTVHEQTVQGFVFSLLHRYAFAGESMITGQTWGTSNSQWGRNTINDVAGTDPADPNFEFRAHWAYYGPHSQRTVSDDWGCPNELVNGVMSAAKFAGGVVLHADRDVDDKTDNLYEPYTTHYINSDAPQAQRAQSQYDETIMVQRYEAMTLGHAPKSQAEEVGDGFADQWGTGIGGYSSFQGFGPYETLAPGDSVHFVVAHGVAGISREKNREVGANWLQYENGTGRPDLIMPDGSSTTDHNAYKKAWVWSCQDSVMQMFRNAMVNYESGYALPQPPPPPAEFTIQSGGDRIRLIWADNAASHPNFDGYEIWRSEGNVMRPETVYEKIWECDASSAVHQYDDLYAVRGFDYYYYIVSKDDGSQDNGHVLKSGKFWTMTSVPAYLRRPQGLMIDQVRVVPNPYDIRSRAIQFGDDFQYDRIAFFEIPGNCVLKIFTERGDLIWEKEHTNGSGDELWDSMTSSGQIVVSGIYILYVEVLDDIIAQQDEIAPRDYVDPKTGDTVYQTGDPLFSKGEKMYSKGENVIRKFVIIR